MSFFVRTTKGASVQDQLEEIFTENPDFRSFVLLNSADPSEVETLMASLDRLMGVERAISSAEVLLLARQIETNEDARASNSRGVEAAEETKNCDVSSNKTVCDRVVTSCITHFHNLVAIFTNCWTETRWAYANGFQLQMLFRLSSPTTDTTLLRMPPGWSLKCFDVTPTFQGECASKHSLPASQFVNSYSELKAFYNKRSVYFTRWGQWHLKYEARITHSADGHTDTLTFDRTYHDTPVLNCRPDIPSNTGYIGCRWP